MFEAWQFLLAHRACLPDTVDFVLYELLLLFECIYFIQEAQNIAVYGDKMLGKMELFRRIVVFRLWIRSGLRKL